MSGQNSLASRAPGDRPRFELPPTKPSIALAVVALSIAAAVSLTVVLIKLSVPAVYANTGSQFLYGGDAPIVLGGISFLIILPTILAAFLGRRALRSDGEVPRGGRAIAGAALGVSGVNALFWLIRVILAILWPQATGFPYGILLISIFSWT